MEWTEHPLSTPFKISTFLSCIRKICCHSYVQTHILTHIFTENLFDFLFFLYFDRKLFLSFSFHLTLCSLSSSSSTVLMLNEKLFLWIKYSKLSREWRKKRIDKFLLFTCFFIDLKIYETTTRAMLIEDEFDKGEWSQNKARCWYWVEIISERKRENIDLRVAQVFHYIDWSFTQYENSFKILEALNI